MSSGTTEDCVGGGVFYEVFITWGGGEVECSAVIWKCVKRIPSRFSWYPVNKKVSAEAEDSKLLGAITTERLVKAQNTEKS
jgi:hypothetical protein